MNNRTVARAVRAALAVVTAWAAVAARADAGAFVCTGQVAFVCGGAPQRMAFLSGGGVQFWNGTGRGWTCRSGDRVAVAGRVEAPSGAVAGEFPESAAHIVTNVTALGRAPFPEAVAATGGDVNGGRCAGRIVRVSGVVASVVRDEMNPQWNWFVLRTATGHVFAAVPDLERPYGGLLRLTDAEVSVFGRVLVQNRWRRFAGPYLMPLGADGLEILAPPPPLAALDDLTEADFTAATCADAPGGASLHRRKTSGVVLAAGRRFCFVQTAAGRILKATPAPGAAVPSGGAPVTVAGFAAADFGGLHLTDAVFAPAPPPFRPAPPAPPQETDLAGLFRAARNPNVLRPADFRRLVTVVGTVAAGEGVVRLAADGRSVTLDTSVLPAAALAGLADGCRVRTTGVCDARFEAAPAAAVFPRFTGFALVPRGADDLVVLSRPPWWTPRRLMFAVASLLALLAAVSALCVAFKILSDRRGRQLSDERMARVRTEAKIEERTRLAVELHDAVSQTLTGVALQIDSAATAAAAGRAGPFLETARNMLRSCRRELQDCLWDLRSRSFEETDMTEAVARAVAPHAGAAAVTVRFNVPRASLSEPAVHALLRIVRELTVNAVRHGGAAHVRIAGERRAGRVRVSVRDDGCGFDAAAAPGPREGHFGLHGIRERLKAAGGTLDIESAPGRGAKVTVEI